MEKRDRQDETGGKEETNKRKAKDKTARGVPPCFKKTSRVVSVLCVLSRATQRDGGRCGIGVGTFSRFLFSFCSV